jgi:hypothetical protein
MGRTSKRDRRSIVAFAFFACFLLLASSFSITYASSTSSKATLPDWIEIVIAARYPNASSTKLDQVRAQVMEQIKINQERIATTHGAVLNYKPSGTKTGSYMYDYLYCEQYNGGTVSNPTYMEGLIDSNYARFYTPELYQNAAIVGQMSSSTAGGDVYIYAKLGPTGYGESGNIFNLWGSNSSDQYGDWRYIGSAEVTTTTGAYLFIGEPDFTFGYIAVGVTTGDSPDYQYNDVMGDIVWATSG